MMTDMKEWKWGGMVTKNRSNNFLTFNHTDHEIRAIHQHRYRSNY